MQQDFIFKSTSEYHSVDSRLFNSILKNNRPAILKHCDFGNCFERWNLEYLTNKIGNESVVIHESDEFDLDFVNKNFKYRTCKFTDFAEILENSSTDIKKHVYLRSTNKDPRSKKSARIEDDFPSLGEDLKPADFIPYGSDNPLYHSSVLRIASSNVQIWTHFDLYDNVLCQVHSTKRVILIGPEDTEYLYVRGDKSLVNNFDNMKECIQQYPLIERATVYSCLIGPGDSLFIPALWWHNIRTLSNDNNDKYSIGFNIFWRDESIISAYGDNDTYGNKNLKPYESAMINLDKALNHLSKLPEKYRDFHGKLLLARLKSKLDQVSDNTGT